MRILDEIDLRTVIVMDIETVSTHKSYQELPEEWKALWDKKAGTLKTEESPESFYERAAIYSEFGKVVSIGVGLFVSQDKEWHFKVKAYSGHDEKELLSDFARMLDKFFYNPEYRFCAHNGREFDIPYLCRRMIINGVRLPSILDVSGLKPWEIKHLDTLDLWKFGDYKAYTSLNVLALSLGIPSPKDDIDGSMVGKVYWQENDLERIDTYCLKDVITTGRVLMKLKGLEPFADDKVMYPEK